MFMVRYILMAAAVAISSAGIARAEWMEAQSKHFVVYSNDRAERVKVFTEQLERFDKAIRVWHVAKEDQRGPSARVTVFVVDDIGEIQQLLGRSDVAGFYVPRAGASVAFTPRIGAGGGLSARAILFHEYAHHWMLSNWTDAALPPWFVEGFAELHATAIFRGDSVIFGAPPLYRRYTVGQGDLLPANQLLRFDPGKLSSMQRDALYSRGWLLTHYLTFDPDRRKQLADYIGALNAGQAADAGKLISGGSNLDLRLTAYAKRPRFSSASISFAQLPIEPVTVRQLAASEAALMPVLIASRRGVDAVRAPRVAALARTLAAPYPNNAFVQGVLAEAEFDVCATATTQSAACYRAAESAADRAVATDPKSVHALVYKGLAQTAALKAAKVTDPQRWAAARKAFLAANAIDKEAPEPLIHFYESFADAGVAPTRNAQAALLYAYALAPYDRTLRVEAARVFLMQDKVAEARVAILPIAFNVEAPATAERARKILDLMNSAGAKAALAEFDRQPTKPGGKSDGEDED